MWLEQYPGNLTMEIALSWCSVCPTVLICTAIGSVLESWKKVRIWKGWNLVAGYFNPKLQPHGLLWLKDYFFVEKSGVEMSFNIVLVNARAICFVQNHFDSPKNISRCQIFLDFQYMTFASFLLYTITTKDYLDTKK